MAVKVFSGWAVRTCLAVVLVGSPAVPSVASNPVSPPSGYWCVKTGEGQWLCCGGDMCWEMTDREYLTVTPARAM